ncbi:MAG TPA: SIMPL domain-containing protein [Candidatus Baltobacteraceae bacterium]
MKRIAIILLSLAMTAAPAVAQIALPTIPAGITVNASGTATTADVLVVLTVDSKLLAKGSSAAAYAQAARAYAGIAAAAGSSANVADLGMKSGAQAMMPPNFGQPTETATVSVAPGDLQAVAARLTAAHFTVDQVMVRARDPDALDAQALAAATRAARARAETIAAADGRHVGRLVNVSPSLASLFKDAAANIVPAVGPLAQMFAQMQSQGQSVTVSESGTYTFELLP